MKADNLIIISPFDSQQFVNNLPSPKNGAKKLMAIEWCMVQCPTVFHGLHHLCPVS